MSHMNNTDMLVEASSNNPFGCGFSIYQRGNMVVLSWENGEVSAHMLEPDEHPMDIAEKWVEEIFNRR